MFWRSIGIPIYYRYGERLLGNIGGLHGHHRASNGPDLNKGLLQPGVRQKMRVGAGLSRGTGRRGLNGGMAFPEDPVIAPSCHYPLAWILGFLFLVNGLSPAIGADFGFRVLQARLTQQSDALALSANIDYRFSPAAVDALRHGVPLTVAVTARILQPRHWFWDEVLWCKRLDFRLQYYPLAQSYQVVDEGNRVQRSFVTLKAALEALGVLQEVPLKAPRRKLTPKDEVYVSLGVKLDIEKLPWALRPLAYLSPQWRLASSEYQWPLFD